MTTAPNLTREQVKSILDELRAMVAGESGPIPDDFFNAVYERASQPHMLGKLHHRFMIPVLAQGLDQMRMTNRELRQRIEALEQMMAKTGSGR